MGQIHEKMDARRDIKKVVRVNATSKEGLDTDDEGKFIDFGIVIITALVKSTSAAALSKSV